MPTSPGPDRSESGFTLLEALVGLVLVALVITAVLQAARTGVLAAERTDRAVTLATAARGVLDRLGADIPLGDGPRSGTLADGTVWRVEPAEIGTIAGVASLYAIRIEIGDADGATVLETHRAIRLRPDGGTQ